MGTLHQGHKHVDQAAILFDRVNYLAVLDNDTDDDGINDGIEFRGYNSSLTSANGDGDGCGDAREIASVNNDMAVTSADVGLVAAAFGRTDMPVYDVTKDGIVSAADDASGVSTG